MKQSTIPSQYYIKPPSVPDFVYKVSIQAWYELMVWSYKEYQERLRRNSLNGNYRELTKQSREYSPVRILAEMGGFRRLCSIMTSEMWVRLKREEQDYLIRCYEMRDHLFRSAS